MHITDNVVTDLLVDNALVETIVVQTVTEIQSFVFYHCQQLTSLTLLDTLAKIGL